MRVGIKTTCSKCNLPLEENRVEKQRYCLACHNAGMRNKRKLYKDYSLDEKIKARCRATLKTAIHRGKFKRLPCQVCGDEKSEAHHVDYTKPYEVMFLCNIHHIEQHKKEKYEL